MKKAECMEKFWDAVARVTVDIADREAAEAAETTEEREAS